MSKHQFSEAAAFAHAKHKALCMELQEAGFDFWDNDTLLHSSRRGCTDNPPGTWGVSLQPDDAGHQQLVFSINAGADHEYGISYGVTLCGKSRGVIYWSWRTDEGISVMTGEDANWTGLDAALKTARLLHEQLEEGGNA